MRNGLGDALYNFYLRRAPKIIRCWIMAFSDQEIKQWTTITIVLSLERFRWMIYERTHEAAKKRTALWRALIHQGGEVTQTQIARAFNVTQQAVSKALKRKRNVRKRALSASARERATRVSAL